MRKRGARSSVVVRALQAVVLVAGLGACVDMSVQDAGMDAGLSCEQISPMLDNPTAHVYPVMDLGPCNHVGDTCQSMSNCMSGRAPRDWMCTCETEAQRWVCGVTTYCPANPTDAME